MPLNYEIHEANSTIELYESVVVGSTAAVHTGTFISSPIREPTIRRKTTGSWVGVVVKNSTVDLGWWMEKIVGQVEPAGRLKMI